MYVGMVLNHALFALLHSEWEKNRIQENDYGSLNAVNVARLNNLC